MNQSPTTFKVFCVGLPKSGTTSAGNALNQLGYTVCHENMGNQDSSLTDEDLTRKCDEAVTKYSAFQDLPWCFKYRRYKEAFTDSKFILTVRPLARWLNSLDIFGDREIPIWKYGFGRTRYRGNELFFRDFCLQHTLDVIDSFKAEPGRLLVLNIESDPLFNMRAVEAFLGLGANPSLAFPHSNVGRRNKIRWFFLSRKWERIASSPSQKSHA